MQLRLPIAELLQGGDRRNDIIAVCARQTVTLAHVMQLLLKRELAGILGVTAVDHVTECRYSLLGVTPQPDRADDFPIDGCDLLALAQISNGIGALGNAHPVGDTPAGTASIQSENESRPLRSPAVDEGIYAQRPVRPDQPSLYPFDKWKIGPPHQRAIAKHPEIFVGVAGIGVHDAVLVWRI